MSLIALIGETLLTAATTIGPVLSEAATFLVTKLPVILEKATICLDAISTVVTKISEILNIAPEGENPQELGAKAMQEGIRPIGLEETTQEYLDYLRNDVELDREKFEKLTDEERLNCEVIGDTMLVKSIEEKTGVELSAEFLLAIPQVHLQYQTVVALIKTFSNAGILSLNDYTRYIANDMSEVEAEKVGSAVKEAIKEVTPEMTQEEIQREIVTMKQEYNTEKY